MIVGFVVLGAGAEGLGRRGISPLTVAVWGMSLFMLQLGLIALELIEVSSLLWVLFGFFGTSGIINYAALSQSFPSRLAGRVNTALNLLVFVVAFAAQWGIGAIINQWPAGPSGQYNPTGYQVAFGIMLGLQLITAIWFFVAGRRLSRGAQQSR